MSWNPTRASNDAKDHAITSFHSLMRKGFLLILISLVLLGCSRQKEASPEKVVQVFYQHYLHAFADVDPPDAEHSMIRDNSPLIRQYVAAETAKRIADIHQIYEQEILSADYFTYCQDYNPEWVGALKVGNASSHTGDVSVPVSIGIEKGKQLQLKVYLSHESDGWKIYRVKNETDHFEQNIFDDLAIQKAKGEAKNTVEK